MRIVLDTSVLINALRSGNGAAAAVLRLVLLGQLTMLLDFKLVCEYRDVAHRPDQIAACGKTSAEIEMIISTLEGIATPVWVAFKHRPLSSDTNDDMVLDIAINGRADWIITNNVRHFSVFAKTFGIQAATPQNFLHTLRPGD